MKSTCFAVFPAMFILFTLLLTAGGPSSSTPVSGRIRIHMQGDGPGGQLLITTSFTVRELGWNFFKMTRPSRILMQVDLPPSCGGLQSVEGSLAEVAVVLCRRGIRAARIHPGGSDLPMVFASWTNGTCSLEVGRHRLDVFLDHGDVLEACDCPVHRGREDCTDPLRPGTGTL